MNVFFKFKAGVSAPDREKVLDAAKPAPSA